ncbi:MAG: hypothetical protein NE328_23975 [Lentisphaeraceae bacterium]|nr:hypothetical protein [Lentisphaeraceae bacterium]
MKNKIILSILLLIALGLVAVVSYKTTLNTPIEDFTHNSPEITEKPIAEKRQAKPIKDKNQPGKKKIVAGKEVNSVNLQTLASSDLQHIANNSDSMSKFLSSLQTEEKLPTSLSLNLILTAISNFEKELKTELIFNDNSPYLAFIEILSKESSVQDEAKNILNNKKPLTAFVEFLKNNKAQIDSILKNEQYSELRVKLAELNNFIIGEEEFSSFESFESLYTQNVCNSEGDSFIEKITNSKNISGNSLKEKQHKIYQYLLRVLPSRIPLSKKYERQIYAAFNTLHIPNYSNNKLNTSDYYLRQTEEAGFNDVELSADFYNMQNQYYSYIEKEGKSYFSAKFLLKVNTMKNFFKKLNDAQLRIPKGEKNLLVLSDLEKEVIHFDIPQNGIINTIDVDGKCIQLNALLKPSASLKVQLFNKTLPRTVLPFYQKTDFKDLLTEK